jgi:hypothetical protein
MLKSVNWISREFGLSSASSEKLGTDALSVSSPGKYRVMKANFGSSADFHG